MLSFLLTLSYPIVAMITYVISYEIRLRAAGDNFGREQANINATIDAMLWPMIFPLYLFFLINRIGGWFHGVLFGGRR